MKRLSAAILVLILFLTSCSALDVIGKDSVRAFSAVLEALAADNDGADGWRMTAPDNGAWFSWGNQSVGIGVDARPFIAAGLDLSKLEQGIVNGDTLIYRSTSFNLTNQERQSSLRQFEADARYLRGYIGYHPEMDHYNISIGNGNMFEWAKDVRANDKDIVFVLNPDPLIAAGVDPQKVHGWTYSQVTVHIDGKPTNVWKFLKPFNLT